jgi:small subunit ribosomal protein S21
VNTLAKVVVQPGQSIEDALSKFSRQVKKSGTLKDVRKREFYEKPGVQKRNKRKEAQRNRIKAKNF